MDQCVPRGEARSPLRGAAPVAHIVACDATTAPRPARSPLRGAAPVALVAAVGRGVGVLEGPQPSSGGCSCCNQAKGRAEQVRVYAPAALFGGLLLLQPASDETSGASQQKGPAALFGGLLLLQPASDETSGASQQKGPAALFGGLLLLQSASPLRAGRSPQGVVGSALSSSPASA